jgi:hypothetical protein
LGRLAPKPSCLETQDFTNITLNPKSVHVWLRFSLSPLPSVDLHFLDKPEMAAASVPERQRDC